MQVKSIAECSFIKLSFVSKIFVLSIFAWSIYIDFTVFVTGSTSLTVDRMLICTSSGNPYPTFTWWRL